MIQLKKKDLYSESYVIDKIQQKHEDQQKI